MVQQHCIQISLAFAWCQCWRRIKVSWASELHGQPLFNPWLLPSMPWNKISNTHGLLLFWPHRSWSWSGFLCACVGSFPFLGLMLNWDNFMYLLTEWEGRMGKICGPRSWRTDRAPGTRAKYFPVRPDLTQSISILLYDHRAFPFFFFLGGG